MGWSASENVIAVEGYFALQRALVLDPKLNKNAFYRTVSAAMGGSRNPGAVMLKFQNISGCLEELGEPSIASLKPRANWQQSLFVLVKAWVANGSYTLSAADASLLGPEGGSEELPASPVIRSAIERAQVRRLHREMQGDLLPLLRGHYGAGVKMEFMNIDFVIPVGKHAILCEVKTADTALACIREGFGQVSEYAYLRPKRRREVAELWIVGPGAPTSEVKDYLGYLNDEHKWPLSYRQYVPNSRVFAV